MARVHHRYNFGHSISIRQLQKQLLSYQLPQRRNHFVGNIQICFRKTSLVSSEAELEKLLFIPGSSLQSNCRHVLIRSGYAMLVYPLPF